MNLRFSEENKNQNSVKASQFCSNHLLLLMF